MKITWDHVYKWSFMENSVYSTVPAALQHGVNTIYWEIASAAGVKEKSWSELSDDEVFMVRALIKKLAGFGHEIK